MKNFNARVVLFSLLGILAFTCFFYFYPAQIFEAEIEEIGGTYQTDISLAAFLDYSQLPQGVSLQRLSTVAPTLKGGFLLFICLVGVPMMIGYRMALKSESKTND